jgi:predicted Zn-dependent peptidase
MEQIDKNLYFLRLENGAKFIFYFNPELEGIYLKTSIKAGRLNDPPDKLGLTHLLEHILGEGTQNFPSSEILASYIEERAGSYNLTTSRSEISFNLSLPKKYLKEAIKISKEIFFDPLFNNFEKEKQIVIQEIKDKITSIGYELRIFELQSRFKKTSPFFYTFLFDPEKVKNIDLEDIISFWENYFAPNNFCFTLEGDFAIKEIEKLIKENYGNLKPKNIPQIDLKDNPFSDDLLSFRLDPKLKITYVNISLPIKLEKEDIENGSRLDIIRIILIALRTSRLFRILRKEKGLVYSIRITDDLFEYGFPYIYIEFESEMNKVLEILEIIKEVIFDFIQKGPTDEELEKAKNYIIEKSKILKDDPQRILNGLMFYLLYYDKIFTLDDYRQVIERTEKNDILEILRKLDFKFLNICLQSPVEDKKILRDVEDLLKDIKNSAAF